MCKRLTFDAAICPFCRCRVRTYIRRGDIVEMLFIKHPSRDARWWCVGSKLPVVEAA